MPILPCSGRLTVVRQRKSCLSSVALGCLKLNTWHPCGFTPGHDVRDHPILAGGIHGLENQQHGVTAGRVQKLLLGAQLLDVILEDGLVVGVVLVHARRVEWAICRDRLRCLRAPGSLWNECS